MSDKIRVLVMDDKDSIRDLAREMLTLMGYEVALASTGEEAIDFCRQAGERGRPYDLVIMDLTVPGFLGGKGAILKLREMNLDLKAVVSSGYSNDPVMSNCRAYGFDAVIPKPYKMQELKEVITKVLNGVETCIQRT